eukprot:TRINITY_DN11512_c0_g1_i1.p3 TRINITY_DN11512_c0_g1~~TRINITY_DN11512_c0_g1_i1.p3  ORF type:complete len:105 (+),score=16.08 TRINITY_DN11512_c0_g1_i1:45-359(+)
MEECSFESTVVEKGHKTVAYDSHNLPVNIYYQIHELLQTQKSGSEKETQNDDGGINVLMIMGLASSLNGWRYQVEGLLSMVDKNESFRICVFDNRGVGESSKTF